MKIVCFSSNTSIWFSVFPEAVIAYELEKRGHDVVHITPGSEFDDRSDPVNENILKKYFKLKGYGISDALTIKDRKRINHIMGDLREDNFENLIIDNINIGKLALYETLLIHKKMKAVFIEKEWEECLLAIRQSLTSFLACRKILKKETLYLHFTT